MPTRRVLADLPVRMKNLSIGQGATLTIGGAAREELVKIAADPAAFLASLDDKEAKGGPIKLPDGSTVARLPGFRRWLSSAAAPPQGAGQGHI
jgi:hypothetical protein